MTGHTCSRVSVEVSRLFVVITKDALGRSSGIIMLPVPQGPEDGGESENAREKSNGNENDKPTHLARGSVRNNRNALAVMMSDDADMTMAAMRSVARPRKASGTAMKL